MSFLSYVVVGGINTLLGIATYGIFLRLGFPYPVASGLSLFLGIVVGFHAHRAFVFRRNGGFLRYLAVWLGIYLLANGLIWLFQRWVGDFLAGVVTTPVNAAVAYLALKRFVFTYLANPEPRSH